MTTLLRMSCFLCASLLLIVVICSHVWLWNCSSMYIELFDIKFKLACGSVSLIGSQASVNFTLNDCFEPVSVIDSVLVAIARILIYVKNIDKLHYT